MITQMRLKHYRAFKDSGWLPLRELTCLVGRNSSGKSSLISALLLLRQSLDERAFGARLPQLALNGRLIECGTYEDLVHNHKSDTPITFSFRFEFPAGHPPDDWKLRQSLVRLDVPRPASTRYARLRRWWPHRKAPPPLSGELTVQFLPEPPFGPTLSHFALKVDGGGEAWFSRTAGERRVQHWRGYTSGLPRKAFDPWFRQNSFFPSLIQRGRRKRGAKQIAVEEFLYVNETALGALHDLLDSIRVVGPFRTPPSRRFTLTSLSGLDVGVSGERTTDLLIAESIVRPKDRRLAEALAYWLKRLELAKGLQVKDIAKSASIFELSIAGAGTARRANFADVGFGISQVLPVLVQGLLVRRGSIFIVQQPELHLHPDAQAGLADYFLYLASHGIRVLVETHSEYLLLRLRRRLAEGIRVVFSGAESGPDQLPPPKPLTAAQLGVFCVADRRGGSRVVDLKIGPTFQFDNLPDGFMGQALEDRLGILAAIRKRR